MMVKRLNIFSKITTKSSMFHIGELCVPPAHAIPRASPQSQQLENVGATRQWDHGPSDRLLKGCQWEKKHIRTWEWHGISWEYHGNIMGISWDIVGLTIYSMHG